jgi:tetratricopeptide (TPR) repeat protein
MNPHIEPGHRLEHRKRILLRALDANPHDTRARSILGLTLLNEGNRNAARAHAEAALSEQPGEALALYVLSIVMEKQDPRKSLELANCAIMANPANPRFYAHLAGLEFSSRSLFPRRTRLRRALEASEKGLLVDADNPDCLAIRGLALCHLGRISEAVASLERALANRPADKVVRRTLFALYSATFSFRKARALLARAF